MIEMEAKADLVEIEASGILTSDDYDRLVPELDRLAAERGRLSLYIELRDFRGWSPPALWKDFKFDVRHHEDMDRIAVVGEKTWEAWLTKLAKLFLKAEMRYFTRDRAEDARRWVRENSAASD